MTKDEAMKLALDALVDVQEMMTTSDWFNERVQAVRQALEQPEQKPVAWSVRNRLTGTHWYTHESKYTSQYYANLYSHRESDGYPTMEVTPLYTAPPKREWVGLTNEEIVKASIGHVEGEHMLPHSFAREIEKLLREKNHD